MTEPVQMIARPSDDVLMLVERLLVERRIAPGALFVPAADVATMIEAAILVGRRLEDAELVADRHCRVCGCAEHRACKGACAWAAQDLCTACSKPTEESAP